MTAGPIPIVLLVKNHTVLPHLAVAQSTSAMNWSDVQLRIFSTDGGMAEGSFALPGGGVQSLRVEGTRLVSDPLGGRVKWRITR
jgi:alpha-D-xyloside xylohydrolase